MNELIENKKKSEVLAERLLKLSYGEVVAHDEIEQIINEKHGSSLYNSIIQNAKKILLNNSRAIESVRGQGYRIVEPDAFVNLSLGHYKRGFHEFQKGTETLASAPIQDMSDEGRQVHRRISDRVALLQSTMNDTAIELKTLAKKEHPFAKVSG